MNHRTAWIVYTLLRLLFFAVPFAAVMLLLDAQGFAYWPTILISTVVAGLVSVSLSVLFLAKPRESASASIYEWRTRDRTVDDIAEDAALDASTVSASPASTETLDASAASADETLDATAVDTDPASGADRAGTETGSGDSKAEPTA